MNSKERKEKIKIESLYKIFGSNPKSIIPLIDAGEDKAEILKKTKCTVGLTNINMSINQGELFVVMGLSGSGKSTLVRCINRLITPTAGNIFFDGNNIMDMDKSTLFDLRKKKISMVFQQFGLLPNRTVLKNVELGLEFSKVEKNQRKEKAMEAIELVGLSGFENVLPKNLSGGMCQRVGLARALATNAEVLLMDEAFSALDPIIRMQMQDELLSIQAKMNKTIVFITHDLDEALKLGDRIAILGDGGSVRQIGTPEEILCNPADNFVKEFIQNVNRTANIRIAAVMQEWPSVKLNNFSAMTTINVMDKYNKNFVFIVDKNDKLLGTITRDIVLKLKKSGDADVINHIKNNVYTAKKDARLNTVISTIMLTNYPIAIVDNNQKYIGIVSKSKVLSEIEKEHTGLETPTLLQGISHGGEKLHEHSVNAS